MQFTGQPAAGAVRHGRGAAEMLAGPGRSLSRPSRASDAKWAFSGTNFNRACKKRKSTSTMSSRGDGRFVLVSTAERSSSAEVAAPVLAGFLQLRR
jgi:hypothetical protein